jgi:peroxiredoxin 2/4
MLVWGIVGAIGRLRALTACLESNNPKREEHIMEQTNAAPVSLPRIGDKAPAFKAVTTQGDIDFPKQYEGSWVILFSHPADFTPVCTTEFITFASMEKQFAEANCKLVGLSVDGLYSHIAWLRTIKEKISYRGHKRRSELPPDRRHHDGSRQGLRHDPARRSLHQGRPRRVLHRSQGRRPRHDLLSAQPRPQLRRDLPRADRPADRRCLRRRHPGRLAPGDDVIIGPAGSCGAAKNRMDGKEDMVCQDWFFCSRKLDKEKVLSTVLKKK